MLGPAPSPTAAVCVVFIDKQQRHLGSSRLFRRDAASGLVCDVSWATTFNRSVNEKNVARERPRP